MFVNSRTLAREARIRECLLGEVRVRARVTNSRTCGKPKDECSYITEREARIRETSVFIYSLYKDYCARKRVFAKFYPFANEVCANHSACICANSRTLKKKIKKIFARTPRIAKERCINLRESHHCSTHSYAFVNPFVISSTYVREYPRTHVHLVVNVV